MYSLLKISAGVLLCLPLTGCVGPGYYDPSTGMVCGGELYGPTNFIDDIKCSLSEHRAARMRKHCCKPCATCCTGSCGNSIPGMLASGTFSTDWSEGPGETYAPETYAPHSSCPNCGPQGPAYSQESLPAAPATVVPAQPAPMVPKAPTTVVPQKITPVPDHNLRGVLNKPAPAPAAEEPMPKSTSVPPALLHAPTVIPQSVHQKNGTRRVQWVPAQIH